MLDGVRSKMRRKSPSFENEMTERGTNPGEESWKEVGIVRFCGRPEAPIGGARAVEEGRSRRIPGEGVVRIGDGTEWRFRALPEGGEGLGGGSRAFQSWRRG